MHQNSAKQVLQQQKNQPLHLAFNQLKKASLNFLIARVDEYQQQISNRLDFNPNKQTRNIMQEMIQKTLFFLSHFDRMSNSFLSIQRNIKVMSNEIEFKQKWQNELEKIREQQQNLSDQFSVVYLCFTTFISFLFVQGQYQINGSINTQIQKLKDQIKQQVSLYFARMISPLKKDLLAAEMRIKIQIKLRLQKIGLGGEQVLRQNMNRKKNYGQSFDYYKANYILEQMQFQFNTLFSTIINATKSRYRNRTTGQNVFRFKQPIKEQIKLDYFLQKITQYFRNGHKRIQNDCFLNLQKMFNDMDLIGREKGIEVEEICYQLKTFSFQFGFMQAYFIKTYKRWWKGRLQQQTRLMYEKHLLFIRYLILTKPKTIVQYFQLKQTTQQKQFTFLMQKGYHSFINFQEGKKFFNKLTIIQKVKAILDMLSCIIQLQQHGISHNDITIRNFVVFGENCFSQKQRNVQRRGDYISGMANLQYKLIDFDVARMVDIPFNYSNYPPQIHRQIYQIRCKLIEISSLLLKKQLKQQHYISKTDKLRNTTPVQNINRLAEYIMLSNKNGILQIMLNENNIRDKKRVFDKQKTLKIINEYQKLIIGKRDCNKFGLLLFKLMLHTDNKLSPYQLQFIQKFVSQSKKGSQQINYKKYLAKISLFSKEFKEQRDKSILRVISQMFVAKLHKRISAKIAYIKLLEIFKIQQYPITFNYVQFKLHIRQIEDDEMTSLSKILNLQEKLSMRKIMSMINQLFKQTVDIKRQNNKQWYQFIKNIKHNSALPYIKIKISQRHDKNEPQQSRKENQNKQKIAHQLLCLVHRLPVQYRCNQNNCKEHLLCIQCMMNMNNSRELIKIKKTHKILHFHDEKINQSHQIICFVVRQDHKKEYLCYECLSQIEIFSQYKEIYYISNEDYSIYNYYYSSGSKLLKPQLAMISNKDDKNKVKEYSKVDFKNMFHLISSVKVDQNEIYKGLFRSRMYMNKLLQDLLNNQKQIMKNFQMDKSLRKIERIIDYIKTKQTILKLKQTNRAKFEQHIKLLHQLIQTNKSNISLANLYSICQYYLQQIKTAANKKNIKLIQTIKVNKYKRQLYLITSRKIFQDYENIYRKVEKQQLKKIVPSKKESAQRRQYNRQKKLYQKDQKLDNNNSSIMSSQISIDNAWKNDSMVDNRQYSYCLRCFYDRKQTIYPIGYCINKQCFNQPFCNDCQKYHQSHIQYTIKFQQNQSKQTDKNLQYFQKKIRELKKTNPIEKMIKTIFSQIEQQIHSLYEIIDNLCERGCYTIEQQFKKIIFPLLKKAILQQNMSYYSDIIWIAQNFTGDPIKFMKVFSHAMERYCFVTSQALPKQICKELNQPEKLQQSQGMRQSEFISNQHLSQFLGNRYRVTSNIGGISTPCEYSAIPHRHFPLVERLILHDIKVNYQDFQYKQQSCKQLQRGQMVKRMMRSNTSDFDIQLYRFYFDPLPSNFMSIISNLTNLKHLQIINQYNATNTFVLKSTQMQAILYRCSRLQAVTIKCVNTLDSYCWQLIKQLHPKCKINICSYSGEVLQKMWVQTLFYRANQIVNPIEYEGEAILQPYQNMQNIESANYKILCDDNHFLITKDYLEKSNRVKNAYRLHIVYNQLSEKDQKSTGKILSALKKYYWCRKTYGLPERRIQQLQDQINEGHQKIQTINKLIFPKYTNITHLTLQGLLFNGQYDPTAEMAQKLLIDSISLIKTLQTLQLNKCFGIKLDYITKNRLNLKRLVIIQCVFKLNAGGIINRQIQMNKLQTLILNRVGLISIDNQKKLLSFELSTIFTQFNIPNVKTIIINNFYEMEDEELMFIQNCKMLQKLSIRRCFKITNHILWKLLSLQNIMHFDFTQTAISSSKVRQFLCKIKREKINLYHNEDLKQLPIDNIKVLKEISRMTNTYHIDSFQNIQSINNRIEYTLSRNNRKLNILNEIDEISLCNVKIREMSQYHLFEIFKIPDLQIIKIQDCQWKNHQKHSSISFNNFPFINSLARIKELSLHKCQIRQMEVTKISEYIYLRKLSLQQNYYLTEFPSIQLTELRYLSLRRTSIAQLDIKQEHMPNLKLVDIQHTEITQFPSCFFQLKKLCLVKYKYSDSEIQRQKKQSINLLNRPQIPQIKSANNYKIALLKWIKTVILNSFIVFSQFEYRNFEEDTRLYIDYLQFTIEADVKGRPQYLWYQQFLQKTKLQQIQYRQQIKYESMKIKSMILKDNKEYHLWHIVDIKNRTKSSKQIVKLLQTFTYLNILHIKSLDNPYFVKIYDLIKQFTDKSDANYIVQFEAVKKFKNALQLRKFILQKSLKNQFSEFLTNSSAFIQQSHLYYTNFTQSGIGYSQQDRKFKFTTLKNIINMKEGQHKQIQQIFRYLVLSNQDNFLICDYLMDILSPKIYDMKEQSKMGKNITLQNNMWNIFEFSFNIPQEFRRSERQKGDLINQLYLFNQKTVDQIVQTKLKQLKQSLSITMNIQIKRLQQLIKQKQQTGKQNHDST